MNNKQKLTVTLFFALVALLLEFVFHQEFLAQLVVTFVALVLAISMFIGMIHTLRSGSYGVDLLAITAILATLAVGEFWASLIIVVMLTGGESLEDYAGNRARRELTALLEQAPHVAHRQEKDGTLSDIPLSEIAVGDCLIVKPGEMVPVDGVILSGYSTFDESSLTGESQPVDKAIGDTLFSGSVNGSARIEFQATATEEDSQYQKIVHLVSEAENTPSRFVRLADRYAVPFTIVAYIIAGSAWAISGDPVRFAEVLVVASPCPLILAAPIAFVAGMSRSSRNGVLVKNGSVIEKFAEVRTIAFDKTGTITTGLLKVDEVLPVSSKISSVEFLQLAASMEQASAHILAKSLTEYAKKEKISFYEVQELEEISGQGLLGTYEGSQIKVGRASFVGQTEKQLSQTAIYLTRDEEYLGAITFSDKIRPESAEVIKTLREDYGENILMLTGDDQETAEKVARAVTIQDVRAELLPDEKLAVLHSLTTKERPSMMVGDGINDAPALALADVGVALGATGSTIASESADVVVLKNDLRCIPHALQISKETMKIAKGAVLIGIFICVVLMLIAATGIIPAIIGALFQEVVDTVSILYALKALRD
ncbi:MAG: cadmium-translocating P-type ATPase [Lactobacillales bacterium]|jgi:heavy metal translocating P-type ATPase|nr:cadmium-translocating P-type ATPase [Lactobacillales bacterium]